MKTVVGIITVVIKTMALLCCISLAACSSSWILVTNNNQNHKVGELSLQAPSGWVIYDEHANQYPAIINGEQINYKVDRLMVTRNGIRLDLIDILQFKLTDAFPSIRQFADSAMRPAELAEKYLAERQIKTGYDDFSIVSNEPVSIAQKKGFRLQYRFKNNEGLQYDKLVYGFVTTNGFYAISYQAPTLHYFGFSLADFNSIIKSIVLKS